MGDFFGRMTGSKEGALPHAFGRVPPEFEKQIEPGA